MSGNGVRRRPRVVSPEAMWEIFLEVTSRETTQAEAARGHCVDVFAVIGIRRAVNDAALAALAAGPGRRATERCWELGQAQGEVAQSIEAVESRAVELALLGGRPAGPERCCGGEGPRAGQGADRRAGRRRGARRRLAPLGVCDGRAHRWRRRPRDAAGLEDREPGGVALHALRPSEIAGVLAVVEQRGPVDRSRRELAQRGSWEGRVRVSASALRRVRECPMFCVSEAYLTLRDGSSWDSGRIRWSLAGCGW
ncbi:hypothetical protein [Candidatus Poriferisodalis sp.]|uniref:hypothetical protein n=1 Tax=Candidatus Poriferisodalis sp. TaxID=3101277 RepID=UPI003B5A6A7C